MNIAKTAASTFASLFLLFSYGIAMFGFFAPGVMVGFSIDLGLTGPAAMFQERVYRRNPTAENMFMALDRVIHANRHSRVIYFSEKFFAHSEKQSIINQVNGHMWLASAGLTDFERGLVSNQLSRLRSAYLASLLATRSYATALGFLDYQNKDIDLQQPCMAYFVLISNNSNGISNDHRQRIRGEFQNYVQQFEEVFTESSTSMTADQRIIPTQFINFTRSYFAL